MRKSNISHRQSRLVSQLLFVAVLLMVIGVGVIYLDYPSTILASSDIESHSILHSGRTMALSPRYQDGSSGEFAWAKQIGFDSFDRGVDIFTDDDNIYVVGSVGFGTNDDILISKFDKTGNTLWAKLIGGSGLDYGAGITVDTVGNVYVTGAFQGNNVDFNPDPNETFDLSSSGDYDVFILKLDNQGDFVWATGMGQADVDVGNELVVDSAGNVYVIGTTRDGTNFDDISLV